jgi:hypothetical protein
VRVERFEPEARRVLALIEAHRADAEMLMRGVQLCHDLFGQHLFAHLHGILYARASGPGEIHRAVAELAHGQAVQGRGPDMLAGWDAIMTYNFDDFMEGALSEQGVPHAALAMHKGKLAGYPDQLAQTGEWYQPVLHLYGYLPRRLFVSSDVDFVFSTAQYLKRYGEKRQGILDVALNQYLANPMHLALHVGCSFADEVVNELLREAARRYPGRMHYALLKWPYARRSIEPIADEIEAQCSPYLEMGVQPVWFDEYADIPGIIRSLK